MTKRKILIYIISAAMIISLAASFLIGTGGGHGGLQDNPGTAPQSVDGRNLLTDPDGAPVAPHDQNMGADDNVAEPATGN